MKNITTTVVGLVLLAGLIGFAVYLNSVRPSVPAPTSGTPSEFDPNAVPSRIEVSGTFECLQHKDPNGIHTMECAFGIKADSGEHYALATELLSTDLFMTLATGERIRVEGVMVPVEQLSSDRWQSYNMRGIINVASASRI